MEKSKKMSGIVEHGPFHNIADTLIVGRGSSVEIISK